MIYPDDHNTLETPEQVAELLAALQSELAEDEQRLILPLPIGRYNTALHSTVTNTKE